MKGVFFGYNLRDCMVDSLRNPRFNHLNRWFLRLPFVDDLTVSLEQIGFVYMLMLSRCPGDSQLG